MKKFILLSLFCVFFSNIFGYTIQNPLPYKTIIEGQVNTSVLNIAPANGGTIGSPFAFFTNNSGDNLLTLRRYPAPKNYQTAYHTLLRIAAPKKVGTSLPAEATVAMVVGDGNSDADLEADISVIDWYNNHYKVGSGGGQTYDESQVEPGELNYYLPTHKAKDKMQYGIRQFMNTASLGAGQQPVVKPLIFDIIDGRAGAVGAWKMIQIDPKKYATSTSNNIIKLFGKVRVVRDLNIPDVFQVNVNDKSIAINGDADDTCTAYIGNRLGAYVRIQGGNDGDNYSAVQLADTTNATRWQIAHATGNVFKIGTYQSGWTFPITANATAVYTLDLHPQKLILENRTVATSDAYGTTGQVCWDSDYVYVCVATNTWKRISYSGSSW